MLARRNIARYWLFSLLGIMGLLALVIGSVPARAATNDTGPVVTIQFHAHLRLHPFWLNFQAAQSRYFATMEACVDPLFATNQSGGYDFGNCFVMEAAKEDYTPISLPEDANYIYSNDPGYWTRPVQVIMPDQFAHTLD